MRLKNKAVNENNSNTEDFSLAEQVFGGLQIHSGFKPTFFTNKDLANLSLTSKKFYSIVSPELKQRKSRKLLTHVVLGEQVNAQAMLQVAPELLLIQSKTMDYSGRAIIATPFQAAIGAGDKPMWEMMLPYFNGLEEGEALRQFHQQFPNGIEDDVGAEALKTVYNAIALAIKNDEDHGLSMIDAFRKNITHQKEIRHGKHFNLSHLIAAYQTYINNFKILANWANRDLFWQKVIGYVQRQMTAYDAQIHCSGIMSFLVNENSFTRTFQFSNDKTLFPLVDDSGLGFDFACFSYSGDGWVGMRVEREGIVVEQQWCEPLKNYVIQKQMHLAGLKESLEQGMHYQLN